MEGYATILFKQDIILEQIIQTIIERRIFSVFAGVVSRNSEIHKSSEYVCCNKFNCDFIFLKFPVPLTVISIKDSILSSVSGPS